MSLASCSVHVCTPGTSACGRHQPMPFSNNWDILHLMFTDYILRQFIWRIRRLVAIPANCRDGRRAARLITHLASRACGWQHEAWWLVRRKLGLPHGTCDRDTSLLHSLSTTNLFSRCILATVSLARPLTHSTYHHHLDHDFVCSQSTLLSV